HWLGPARPGNLARWAGVDRSDAQATCNALGRELMAVATTQATALMLASDHEQMSTMQAGAVGARLLPLGDPYLSPHGGLRVAAPPADLAQRARDLGASDRLVNSLAGRVLLDGS